MKPHSIRPETLTSTSSQSREVKIRMWQFRVKDRQSQFNLFCILSKSRRFRAYFAEGTPYL